MIKVDQTYLILGFSHKLKEFDIFQLALGIPGMFWKKVSLFGCLDFYEKVRNEKGV
jgi:hypothetical protein